MRTFLLFFCLVLSFGLQAQVEDESRPLPRGFAEGEEALMPAYMATLNARSVACINDVPNDAAIRTPAEWEEMQAVVITWTGFPSILSEIVRHAREEVEVIIVCSNDNVVKNQLNGAGVDWSSNVTFIEDDFNSIWVRDYGPNSVYMNDVDELAFVDWIYNRPRPLDDAIPEVIADYLQVPNYCTTVAPNDLVHTGGNFMSDGIGQGFSSRLVDDENGPFNDWGDSNHSPEDVDNLMYEFMGIESYVKMQELPYDLIHHIDMHMKLLDEERILIGEYPEGISDGPQIEANIQYILNNYTNPYGEPYEFIRIPMPPEGTAYPWTGGDYRTYANALFLNKLILVPTYQEQYDTTALRIWEEAMPGYNVVGIDCNAIIPLSGALHCITKEVAADEPLLITHQKVKEACYEDNTPLSAAIRHKSGIASAMVYYTTDLNSTWQTVDMSDAGNDEWTANIPPLDEASDVHYYIEATANDGKVIQRPIVAPEGFWTFTAEACLVSVEEGPSVETTSLEAIFPNPAKAITCIPVLTSRAAEATITLKDVLGRDVTTIFQGQLPEGESKYFINAADFAAGTYFINLQTETGQDIQKLVISHNE